MISGDVPIEPVPDTVPMTRELRAAIKHQFDRTGLNPRLFMKGRRRVPAGLDARTINGWIKGQVRDASAAHVSYLIDTLTSLPDGTGTKCGPRTRASENRKITITPDMLAELRSEMARTGASRSTLMHLGNDVPDGLTLPLVQGWLSEQTKTAREDHWAFVMSGFRSIPDDIAVATQRRAARNKPLYSLLTDEEREALRKQRDRTGMRGNMILKFAEEKPDNLTASMIDGWLSGAIKSAKAGHVEFVLKLYASIPDSRDGRVC